MLSLRGLGKDYGHRTAVRSIDLEVARGEALGLLGPNGAGKTTTLSMICGVVAPTRGHVTIEGVDVHAAPYIAKARLGLVPQELALYDELSARHNLQFAGALYGLSGKPLADRIQLVLELVGLANRARDAVGTFSGGMKRRLNLAAALVHQPRLLVLDEPTVGVDTQSRHHIAETVKALKASGITIIYTSHYLEEVEALCDRIAIVDGGELVATGDTCELIAGRNLQSAFLSLTGHALRDVA